MSDSRLPHGLVEPWFVAITEKQLRPAIRLFWRNRMGLVKEKAEVYWAGELTRVVFETLNCLFVLELSAAALDSCYVRNE